MVNEKGTNCGKASVLILVLLLICCVTLGKSVILSGLSFLISSVRGLSGSSRCGILRSSNLGGWLEIPLLNKEIYAEKYHYIVEGSSFGDRPESGKEVKFSGNKSSVCNWLIPEVNNSSEQLSILNYVTSKYSLNKILMPQLLTQRGPCNFLERKFKMQVVWFSSASDSGFFECLCWSLMDTRIHLIFHILKTLEAEDWQHQA